MCRCVVKGAWQLVSVPFRRAGKVSSHLLAATDNFAAVVTFQRRGKANNWGLGGNEGEENRLAGG